MDFNEFIGNVVDNIPDYLPAYDIENIHVAKVFKNNGILCTGMAVCMKGESISPNIYLEYYYNMYKSGVDMIDILTLIKDEYNIARERMTKELYEDITKENLEKSIFMKLVNYEKNQEILKDCPFIPFYDLAITFRFLVRKDEEGIASSLISNREAKSWNVTPEELYDMAKANTRKLFPPILASLESIIEELMPDTNFEEKTDLFVLTNEQKVNGAACMVYQDIIQEFADKCQTDLYILPSSIHEVLLLPISDRMSLEELREMVIDINEYVVDDMDYLSDTVYMYDYKTRSLHL